MPDFPDPGVPRLSREQVDLVLQAGLQKKTRRNSARGYLVGTVFRESEGLFVVYEKHLSIGTSSTYYLCRLPPDLEALVEVMGS